jgi:hypothetical protein
MVARIATWYPDNDFLQGHAGFAAVQRELVQFGNRVIASVVSTPDTAVCADRVLG